METEGQCSGATAPRAPAAQLGQPRPGAYAATIEPPPEPNNEWKRTVWMFDNKNKTRFAEENDDQCYPQESIADVATGVRESRRALARKKVGVRNTLSCSR